MTTPKLTLLQAQHAIADHALNITSLSKYLSGWLMDNEHNYKGKHGLIDPDQGDALNLSSLLVHQANSLYSLADNMSTASPELLHSVLDQVRILKQNGLLDNRTELVTLAQAIIEEVQA